MARRTRHSLPGAIYHVMIRGNNAQEIFSSDQERLYFIFLMEEGVHKYGHQILAFCLMRNHVHLAIRVGNVPLSKICQNLSFRYTRYYNYEHNTLGHLFQGRFKSILVDGIGYLRQLIRYIHLNPIRAGVVDDPLHYPWSSHQAYLMHKEYAWLARNLGLSFFGDSPADAVECYRRFALSGVGREEEIDFKKGIAHGVVGDEMFIASMQDLDTAQTENPKQEISIETLLLVVSDWFKMDRDELLKMRNSHKDSHIRGMLAYLALNSKGVSTKELANLFNRAENTISQAAKRFELKMSKSEFLRKTIDELNSKLVAAANDQLGLKSWRLEA